MVREAEEIQEINMQDVEAEIEQLRADIEAFYLEHPQNDPLLPDKIWVKDMNELEEKITEHIPKKVVEDEIIIKNTIEKEGGINPEGSNPLDFSRMREFDLPEEYLNEVFLPDEAEGEDGKPDEKAGKEPGKKSVDDQELSLFSDAFQQSDESTERGAASLKDQEVNTCEISDIMANDLIRESFGDGLLNDLGKMNEDLINRIYTGEHHAENGSGPEGAVKTVESVTADKSIAKENTQDLLRDLLQHGELQAEVVNTEEASAEMNTIDGEASEDGGGDANVNPDADSEGEKTIEDLLSNSGEGGQTSENDGDLGLQSKEIDQSKEGQEENHTEEDPVNKIFISQKRREKTEGDSGNLNTEEVETAGEQKPHSKNAPKVKQKEKITIKPIIKEVYAEEVLEEKKEIDDYDKQNHSDNQEEIERILSKTVEKAVGVKTENSTVQEDTSKDTEDTKSKDTEDTNSIEDLLQNIGKEDREEKDDLLRHITANLDAQSEMPEENNNISAEELHGKLALVNDRMERYLHAEPGLADEGNDTEESNVFGEEVQEKQAFTDDQTEGHLQAEPESADEGNEAEDILKFVENQANKATGINEDENLEDAYGQGLSYRSEPHIKKKEKSVFKISDVDEESGDTSISDTEELLRQILDGESDVSGGEEIQEKQVYADDQTEGHLHAEPESADEGHKDEDILKFVEDSIIQTEDWGTDQSAAESKAQTSIKARRNEAEKMLGRKRKKEEQKKRAAQALKNEQEEKTAKKELVQVSKDKKSTTVALYEKPKQSFLSRLLDKLRSLFKKKVPLNAETAEMSQTVTAVEEVEVHNTAVEEGQVVENEMQIFGVVNGAISGETIIINEHAVIKNNIEAKERVLCMKHATIMGSIKAKEVIVEGIVRGRINAEREVTVKNSGLVVGDIRARQVSIAPQAVVDGDIILNR